MDTKEQLTAVHDSIGNSSFRAGDTLRAPRARNGARQSFGTRHTARRALRVARGVRASSLVSFPAPLPQDLVANCVPHVKKNIGMLTAFQCFWRPLATAETRRDLARKCKRGLAARGIDVAPTLSLLLTSLAVD